MENNRENDFFKDMANRYVETYGCHLQQELDQIRQQNIQYYTPVLDLKINRFRNKRKTKRFALGISALAACLLLVFLTPNLLRYFENSNITQSSSETSAIIPMSFALPKNLSVSSTEQDHGQSIYRLHDALQDDVVLVLEETDQFINTEGMTPIMINGSQVYARSTGDYNLLIFNKEGILYTLTCKYDINTLVGLGKNIL